MKWTEPPGPVPSWLDAADEVTHDDPKLDKAAFIAACVNACVANGCNAMQAIGATANACNETAYGRFYRAWNLGGVKITKLGANNYRAAHSGQGPKWWCAPGNKAPGATLTDYAGGDPPWCYYRAYDSLEAFLGEWLTHFVPRPEVVNQPNGGLYRTTGQLFWAGDPGWFRAMCRAGYKGSNTQKAPDASVAEWESMCRGIAVHYAQTVLSVESDGNFGPASQAACLAFQQAHGVTPTGALDAATLDALAAFARAH